MVGSDSDDGESAAAPDVMRAVSTFAGDFPRRLLALRYKHGASELVLDKATRLIADAVDAVRSDVLAGLDGAPQAMITATKRAFDTLLEQNALVDERRRRTDYIDRHIGASVRVCGWQGVGWARDILGLSASGA
jgi:hypothetical protein